MGSEKFRYLKVSVCGSLCCSHKVGKGIIFEDWKNWWIRRRPALVHAENDLGEDQAG